ncbi:hypothetical protein AV530_003957 [Patagioenas fasciata monilis]|uniref:Uncharacterized protein n=1 Tax=Patagioenas fasciata monilis TaxID=372326 RepID=A0A1V4JLB7_PATFA|nr:hypothetical protein AV530_003957 [Patagioenas fasciata monilis]
MSPVPLFSDSWNELYRCSRVCYSLCANRSCRFLRKRAWTACKVVKYLQTARMILLVVAYGENDSLE